MGIMVILLTYCKFRGYHLEIGVAMARCVGIGIHIGEHSQNAAISGQGSVSE
jgi:hypothetical protein